jgi:TPR repeat protein
MVTAVAQDYARARQWYQKAADAGNTGAKQVLSYWHSK